MLKALIKKMFGLTGYYLYKRGAEHYTMEAALRRLKERGISPGTIIDIGAAEGEWTKLALSYWPNAHYHLIEPLKEQESKLKNLRESNSLLQYHLAVAGERSGEVTLNISDDLDGSGIYAKENSKGRKVPVINLDDTSKGTNGPYLIKFDTHGYEDPILKGATGILPDTIAIVMEVYNFRISPTCLLFHEMTAHMETLGFRLADLVDVGLRPKDQIFWQADAIYLRADHPVFVDNQFR
jgi:FkbM family methyltransferase